jgi:hypothetical protein
MLTVLEPLLQIGRYMWVYRTWTSLCSWISYRHLPIYTLSSYLFTFFLMVYPCFAFRKCTTHKLEFRALVKIHVASLVYIGFASPVNTRNVTASHFESSWFQSQSEQAILTDVTDSAPPLNCEPWQSKVVGMGLIPGVGRRTFLSSVTSTEALTYLLPVIPWLSSFMFPGESSMAWSWPVIST